MTNVALIAAYAALSVAGLLLLKLGAPALRDSVSGLAHLPLKPLVQVAAGGILYVASFALWVAILSRVDLAIAYPVSIGLTLALLAAVSAFVLKESLGLTHLLGIGLIFAGIVLVTRASGSP